MKLFLNTKNEFKIVELQKIFFKTYKNKIYKIAYGVVMNEHDAKDIVQDTIIKAAEKINQLNDIDKLESWICSIAYNLARQKYNRNKRNILIEDSYTMDCFINNSQQTYLTEDLLEKKEFRKNILKHMACLKNHHSQILYLYYFLDLSYEEISTFLGISIGTVKSRLYRAKELLKSKLISHQDCV